MGKRSKKRQALEVESSSVERGKEPENGDVPDKAGGLEPMSPNKRSSESNSSKGEMESSIYMTSERFEAVAMSGKDLQPSQVSD